MAGLSKYSVLVGRPISHRFGEGENPHYQVHVIDDTTDYRIAINVKSKLAPSELAYYANDNFQHPMLDELVKLIQRRIECWWLHPSIRNRAPRR